MKTIIFVGTRPEAIKLVPLYKVLSKNSQTLLVSTGQHKEMVNQIFTFFDVQPDFEFNLMTKNQPLADIFSKVFIEAGKLIAKERPNLIIVQGDTSTALASALAAFYEKTDIAHIEAGLRTHEFYSPFPEEKNRELISRIARFHFAPTVKNKRNLLSEGIASENIHVVGNTVIDALLDSSLRIDSNDMNLAFSESLPFKLSQSKYILITGHRRENFGGGIKEICDALKILSKMHPDVYFVYPVHLNPNIKLVVDDALAGMKNIFLLKPQSYDRFIYLMSNCFLILTDSGGIQEEAPSLNKPVLLMRNSTERPEGVSSGAVSIVGASSDAIVTKVNELMTDNELYSKMINIQNPYGDGRTSYIITEHLTKAYN